MRTLGVLALAAVLLTACGGSHTSATTTTVTHVPKPGPGRVLYLGGTWAVTIDHGRALALRLSGNRWHVDGTRRLSIAILGPKPRQTVGTIPQVAVELKAPAPLVESGIWVDGVELAVKGGGTKPTEGTIYGAPIVALTKGRHTAVAYARTATTATAVAWSFRVR